MKTFKGIFIVLLASFVTMVFSKPSDSQLNQCEQEGRKFGDGKNVDLMPIACLGHFSEMASPEAKKMTKNYKVTGYRNILFVERQTVKSLLKSIIAGVYTELEEVVAVAIDEPHNEIAVLEKSGDILFFSGVITGNVAPYRILKHEELDGASDLVMNPETNEVIVYNKKRSSLLFFSRLANIAAPEGHKKLSLIRGIEKLPALKGLALSKKHQELFLLDAKNKQILVYDIKDKANKFVRIIKIESDKKIVPVKLDYSIVNDEIIVHDPANEEFKFPRVAD